MKAKEDNDFSDKLNLLLYDLNEEDISQEDECLEAHIEHRIKFIFNLQKEHMAMMDDSCELKNFFDGYDERVRPEQLYSTFRELVRTNKFFFPGDYSICEELLTSDEYEPPTTDTSAVWRHLFLLSIIWALLFHLMSKRKISPAFILRLDYALLLLTYQIIDEVSSWPKRKTDKKKTYHVNMKKKAEHENIASEVMFHCRQIIADRTSLDTLTEDALAKDIMKKIKYARKSTVVKVILKENKVFKNRKVSREFIQEAMKSK